MSRSVTITELAAAPRVKRTIVLGDGHRVTLRAYLAAVKRAKANPDREFDRGLTCWWPCTGREIVGQFRDGMHDRINQRGA